MIIRPIRQTLLLGTIGVALSGCAAALLGVGAAGGYAISRDSISNQFELPASHLYHMSREVMGELGIVTREDESRGWMNGTVGGVSVTLTIRQISERMVELKVKARNKFLMPRIGVAQTVYNRILQRL